MEFRTISYFAPRDRNANGTKKTDSIQDLPMEIQLAIFKLVPRELRSTCKQYYIFYNSYYYDRLIKEMGPSITYNIAIHDLPYLINYIKSFDYWRKTTREVIAATEELCDYIPNIEERRKSDPGVVINCKYIADSWHLIYGIYKNRRLFLEYQDYQVDEPKSDLRGGMLYVDQSYILKYKKTIKLSPGLYNLACGVIIKNARGFSGTEFKVHRSSTQDMLLRFFPPQNFAELIPQEKFTLLNTGYFEVKEKTQDEKDKQHFDSPLVDVDITMEESGLYLKSGFTICYIDVNAYPLSHQTTSKQGELRPIDTGDWIAWWAENMVPRSELLINRLLKDLYKSINRSLSIVMPKNNESPYQRIGSFAELTTNVSNTLELIHRPKIEAIDEDAEYQHENETEVQGFEYDEDDTSNIDIDTYNEKYFCPFNDEGEPLVRCFRYCNNYGRRTYERRTSMTKERLIVPRRNEPLKWKLTAWFDE